MRTDRQTGRSQPIRLTRKKAFTLVELLVVIAVIGILFIALVIKMSFATDKAKVSGIETDFRSYQMAFKAVATENAGFSDLVDTSATNPYTELERQINKNLDPDMKISIGKDGSIKSNAADKWGNLYQGRYLPPDEDGTVEDKGAIIMLSPGSDASLGISATIENGIVVFGYLSGKSYEAADDYATVVIYTLKNGHGEAKINSFGFDDKGQVLLPVDSAGNNDAPDETDSSSGDSGNTPHTHIPGLEATCTTSQKCTVCGIDLSPATGHSELTLPAVEATCIETGLSEGKYCAVCNAVLKKQEVIDVKGHSEVTIPGVDPTCIQSGLAAGKYCPDCDTILVPQEVIGATGHTPNQNATCTDPQHCIVCGDLIRAASGHAPGAEATCTTAQKCAVCKMELVSAKGHVEVIDVAIDPTCTTTGLTEGKHCSVCNAIIEAQNIIAVLGHIEVIDEAIAATCITPGLTKGIRCSRCGETLTVQTVIPETGHTNVIDQGIAATCTVNGKSDGSHCSVCGEITKEQSTIDALGHDFVIDQAVAATCTQNGYTEGKHCTRCDYKVAQEKIPMINHSAITDNAITATCLTDGLTSGTHCIYCNTILTSQVRIPANGHVEVIDPAVPATCTASGWSAGIHCSDCNEVLVAPEIVPATGHIAVIDSAIAASCISTGLTEGSHCSKCGDVIVAQSIIEILPHDYDSNITKASTCISAGKIIHTCLDCSNSYTEVIPSLGHVDSNADNKCDRCESSLSDETTYTLSGKWIFDEIHTKTSWTSGDELKYEYVDYSVYNNNYGELTGYTLFRYVPVGQLDNLNMNSKYENCEVVQIYNQVPITLYHISGSCESCDLTDSTVNPDFKIVWFKTPQNVSKEFYEWFTTNAIIDDTPQYELSGKWIFNDSVPTTNIGFSPESISFVSNETQFQSISIYSTKGIQYGSKTVYGTDGNLEGWENNEAYKTINFGSTPQEVTELFYNWFIANATPANSYELSGVWTWNSSISLDNMSNFNETINFTSNGTQFSTIKSVSNGTSSNFKYSSINVISQIFSREYIHGLQYFFSISDNYKTIDFGEVPQEVSRDFYVWFIGNATSGMGFELSGDWLWNEEIDFMYNELRFESIAEYINYMYEDGSGLQVGGTSIEANRFSGITYNNDNAYDCFSWSASRKISFGSEPQEVDSVFYVWFTENAKKIFIKEVECDQHTYTETIIVQSECTKTGVISKTCSNCGYTVLENIPATGHTEVYMESIAATCTQGGQSEGMYCSTCNAILIGSGYTNALGHNYVSSTDPATCTTDGLTIYTCERCEHSYVTTIEATGHIDVNEDDICDVCSEAVEFFFYIDGVKHIGDRGMTWTQWCESNYNTGEYNSLANTRVIQYKNDRLSTLYYSEMTTIDGNTSMNLIDVNATDNLKRGCEYKLLTIATNAAPLVLRASDNQFVRPATAGYTTYEQIANALKTSEILAAITTGGVFTDFDDCYATMTVYIAHNGVLKESSLATNCNVMSGSISLSLSGIPDDSVWYLADTNQQPIGDILATGSNLSYQTTNSTDFVVVVSTPEEFEISVLFKSVGSGNPSVGEDIILYDANSNKINVFTTDENGKVEISGLKPGKYTLTGRYYSIWVDISEYGTVSSGYVEAIASFQLLCSNTDPHQVSLYDQNHNLITIQETNSEGYAKFYFVPEGTYYVQIDSQSSQNKLIVDSNGSVSLS